MTEDGSGVIFCPQCQVKQAGDQDVYVCELCQRKGCRVVRADGQRHWFTVKGGVGQLDGATTYPLFAHVPGTDIGGFITHDMPCVVCHQPVLKGQSGSQAMPPFLPALHGLCAIQAAEEIDRRGGWKRIEGLGVI